MNQVHGILGQNTSYPKTYSPDILFKISRQLGRQNLMQKQFLGIDYWHCFELSWLNTNNIPQVGILRLIVPAQTEYIVESKSLKLYLNSLNFMQFNDKQHIADTIKKDISDCLEYDIEAVIFSLDDVDIFPRTLHDSICLEEIAQGNVEDSEDVRKELLIDAQYQNDTIVQRYHCHLLRSNCPVTNQPDWGTVQIVLCSGMLNPQKLLAYILSYRNHNGFHEQCIEQIFDDLTQIYSPQSLLVRAWYTRRGGIDINPVRVNNMDMLAQMIPTRLVRQ